MSALHENIILAFVGMPGAGKSEAAAYLKQKGVPFVRFGDLTDEGIKAMGLSLTPENERFYREKIRHELGMGAYAIKAEPKLNNLLKSYSLIAIDGLYSWEEYTFLKEKFPNLLLIHVYAEPAKRYKRLAKRPIRPVPYEESRNRDVTELEKLNKGGPIAIADYIIENDTSLEDLHSKIDRMLAQLNVTLL